MCKVYNITEKWKDKLEDICKGCNNKAEVKKCFDGLAKELEKEVNDLVKLFSRAKALNSKQQAEINKLRGR